MRLSRLSENVTEASTTLDYNHLCIRTLTHAVPSAGIRCSRPKETLWAQPLVPVYSRGLARNDSLEKDPERVVGAGWNKKTRNESLARVEDPEAPLARVGPELVPGLGTDLDREAAPLGLSVEARAAHEIVAVRHAVESTDRVTRQFQRISRVFR